MKTVYQAKAQNLSTFLLLDQRLVIQQDKTLLVLDSAFKILASYPLEQQEEVKCFEFEENKLVFLQNHDQVHIVSTVKQQEECYFLSLEKELKKLSDPPFSRSVPSHTHLGFICAYPHSPLILLFDSSCKDFYVWNPIRHTLRLQKTLSKRPGRGSFQYCDVDMYHSRCLLTEDNFYTSFLVLGTRFEVIARPYIHNSCKTALLVGDIIYAQPRWNSEWFAQEYLKSSSKSVVQEDLKTCLHLHHLDANRFVGETKDREFQLGPGFGKLKGKREEAALFSPAGFVIQVCVKRCKNVHERHFYAVKRRSDSLLVSVDFLSNELRTFPRVLLQLILLYVE
jgi:hypothetical protein